MVGFGYFLGIVFGKPFDVHNHNHNHNHNHDTDHKSEIILEESRLQLRDEKEDMVYDCKRHIRFSLGSNGHQYPRI